MFPTTRIPAELRDISDYIANTILLLRNFKSYIVYLTPQTISNEKVVNGKVVYLVEYFNLMVTSCSFDIVNNLKSDLTTYITYLDLWWTTLNQKVINYKILNLFNLYNINTKLS